MEYRKVALPTSKAIQKFPPAKEVEHNVFKSEQINSSVALILELLLFLMQSTCQKHLSNHADDIEIIQREQCAKLQNSTSSTSSNF